ncbi:MAG: hypothetical protein HYX76_06280, partial [Acidobacteria bacterium]|nr:hypothetical protein [Acidobacteriota bacterium]
MSLLRRVVHIVALVGTLLTGSLALAIIVSQTPWFKDWLRRYIIRETQQYLNGEVSIGSVGGSLFYGVDLTDLTIRMAGQTVLTIKDVKIDYSVFEVVSGGVKIDDIRLNKPAVLLVRDAQGWNLGRLIKQQAREKDRRGPKYPISIGEIGLSDASFVLSNPSAGRSVRVPARIDRVNASFSFHYEPVRYTIAIHHVSLRTHEPALDLNRFTGTIALADENVYLDELRINTAESELRVDGTIDHYLTAPAYNLTAGSGKFSLSEISRIVPAVAGIEVQPVFKVATHGAADRLEVAVDVKSTAGDINGNITTNALARDKPVAGRLHVAKLNLAPLLNNPSQKSDITGRADLNLVLPAASPMGRLRGSYRFEGPAVAYAGYRAADVRATGSLDGPRITVAAVARAYGARTTTKGTIIRPTGPGEVLQYTLEGRASGVDLRALPRTLAAPRLASRLALDYRLTGRGLAFAADARMHASVLEGARIGEGTIARLTSMKRTLRYEAEGTIANLDTGRVTRKLRVAALASRHLSTDITGRFTARGATGRGAPLEADVRLARSLVEGATFRAGTVAHFAMSGGNIEYAAKGHVEHLDLQRMGRALNVAALREERFAGLVNGDFDVRGRGTELRTLAIDANGRLVNTRLLGGEISALDFGAHLANSALRVRAQGDFAKLDPAMAAANPTYRGSLTGSLDGEFAVAGLGEPIDLSNLMWNGRANLTNSRVADVDLDAAELDADYANRVGRIRRFSIKGPDLNATASGTLALDERSQSNLAYHVEATHLARFRNVIGEKVDGAAIVDGSVSGNRSELGSTGTFSGANVRYGDNSALSASSRFTVALPGLRPDALVLTAQTKATFVRTAGREINEVTATTTYRDKQLEFSGHLHEGPRELDASGTILFHPDHQELHLRRLALSTEGVTWTMAPSAEAAVQYGPDRLVFKNVRLTNGNQVISVDGGVGMKPGSTGTLDVKAAGVDLAELDRLMLGNQQMTGTLDLSGRLTGSTDAPRFDGNVEVKGGSIRGYTFNSFTADIGYTRAGMSLDARLGQAPGEVLTAKGTAPLTLLRGEPTERAEHVAPGAEDIVDLRIQTSNIGLNVVQALTPELANVRGAVTTDVHLTGSGRDPHMAGFVEVRGGAFEVLATREVYTGLDTRLDLHSDRVVIQAFQLLDKRRNPLNISGEMTIHQRGVGALQVALTSHQFEII